MPTPGETRILDVDYLARVEGEGSLKARVRGGDVEIVEFGIFEPPRFFEAFLRGRRYSEAPDITARICGICPVAYLTSACNAIESIFGTRVEGQLRQLRRLLYCGEWIESHVLHAAMLHLPDFLGYESAIHMAADHREIVETALRLKKTGNDVMVLLAGREIHPVNMKVGGWYRVPTRAQLETLVPDLEWAHDAALELIDLAAGLPMPEMERDVEFVALSHPEEYAVLDGRIVSSRGIDADVSEFNDLFEEIHVERSNALQSKVRERGPYHVGPLARYSLNFEKLAPAAQEAARRAGLGERCTNPFQSIIVRAVETLHAVDEALGIIDRYQPPSEPAVPVVVSAGEGHGASEAPRGLLYHRYVVDDGGSITEAQIVPPTAQNQLAIEADLRVVLEENLGMTDDELQWRLEQSIRNYDPCISCATHFLRLEVDRG